MESVKFSSGKRCALVASGIIRPLLSLFRNLCVLWEKHFPPLLGMVPQSHAGTGDTYYMPCVFQAHLINKTRGVFRSKKHFQVEAIAILTLPLLQKSEHRIPDSSFL